MMNFGAFVAILPGKEGLVHISQLAPQRVERVEDVVKIGDQIMVKVIEIDARPHQSLAQGDAARCRRTTTVAARGRRWWFGGGGDRGARPRPPRDLRGPRPPRDFDAPRPPRDAEASRLPEAPAHRRCAAGAVPRAITTTRR